MLVKSLAVLFSLCCVARLSVLPSLPLLSLSVPLLIALYALRRRVGVGTVPLILFICGFVYGCIYASFYLSRQLPSELLNVEVEIVASVVDLPGRDERRLRFLAELESIKPIEGIGSKEDPVPHRGRIRLSWYGKDAPDLVAGNKVRLVVKLKAPSGFLNPGGFDLERWLAQNKIVATGYVRNKSFDVSQSVVAQSFTPVSSARHLVHRRLLQASNQYQSRGVIAALAVGDRSGVTPELWQTFISTGTNHLLAISGLHISLVAGAFALLSQSLWRYAGLSGRSTRRGCSLAVALVAAFIYAAMAGFSVPTVRALMMFSVLVFLLVVRRHQHSTQSLSVALVFVCITDPLSVLSPGFWMSFTAVAVLFIVFSNSDSKNRTTLALRVMRGHLLVTIGLYPLTVLFFGQASLISPVANLVVTPLIGMLVTPLVFIAALLVLVSVPLASYVLYVADALLRFAFFTLEYFASLPFALIKVTGFSNIALLLAAITAILMLVPVTRTVRLFSLLLLLPLFFPGVKNNVAQGDYRVVFLDVGQGTSIVVMTSNRTLVYDTGDQFSSRFSAANAVLLPYLRSKSVSTVDRLIVSHADRDHSGGADEVLDALHVSVLMLSEELPQRPDAQHLHCLAGDSWVWDDVHFKILHPQPGSVGEGNDQSCVLMITTTDGVRTLLPGDIESYAENFLLASGSLPPVQVLLSPHHGSATSSGEEFVRALKPAYVVHTTGYKNRFKFPRPEVTDRYQAIDAVQFNTAYSGAIDFLVSDSGVSFSEYRVSARRWWHRR